MERLVETRCLSECDRVVENESNRVEGRIQSHPAIYSIHRTASRFDAMIDNMQDHLLIISTRPHSRR